MSLFTTIDVWIGKTGSSRDQSCDSSPARAVRGARLFWFIAARDGFYRAENLSGDPVGRAGHRDDDIGDAPGDDPTSTSCSSACSRWLLVLDVMKGRRRGMGRRGILGPRLIAEYAATIRTVPPAEVRG